MDTQSAGIGGGHFMTIYNATTKKCHVVDAREAAPLAASENMYKDRGNKSKFGWEAVAVPGELHGLWTEYQQFGGKVPWKSLVQPTVQLMQEGYPTSHALAAVLRKLEPQILKEPTVRPHFINPKTKRVYKVGEQIKTRSNFMETLKVLASAEDPVKEFYNGALTDKMVEEFKRNGGLLTKEDFARYHAIIRPDSDVIYTDLSNDRRVCGPPPPSGSAVTQAILKILDGYTFNMTTVEGNTNIFHQFLEASKFAYAARSYFGDMDFIANASAIAKTITSEEWAKQISLGAMVMSESTGIVWNDEMDDFSSPGHPNYFGFPPTPANYIKPGKRPMSSMSPLIVFNTKNSSEVLSIGAAGGSAIISGVAGAAFHVLHLHHDVKEAIDFPRLHNQLKPNVTQYEARWPLRYIDELRNRGHTFKSSGNGSSVVTAVQRMADGTVYANSDFRKGTESEPAGY
ncbi:Protein C53D5.5 [Aphelenchoides avenae]|nr:Protein C53D5.5 [Aphelenchus avenae]